MSVRLSFASFVFSLLFGSSALRSSPLSERFFTTMASADSSRALTPEVSPVRCLLLSERAVWLYLMRLGGFWTSPVPSQLVARIRPLCQFVFLRSLVCLALLSSPDLAICCLHFGYGYLHQFR